MKAIRERLLQQYNQRQNLLVVSEYARYREGATGLASFSRNTIDSILKKNSERGLKTRIIVLANIIDKEEIYEEDGRLVIRCIKHNSLSSLVSLCIYVSRFPKVENVLCEFEFASYGGIKIVSLFPFLLLYLRVCGKRVFFVLHQVVVDLKNLTQHLGLAKYSFKLKVLQEGLQIFYTLVGLFANKIIVLEEEFKLRLARFIAPKKITVISHGVPQTIPQQSKAEYRAELDISQEDFVFLVFGYVTWYKGTDRLIEVFRQLPERIAGQRLKLIIAGGKSNAQAGKLHYRRFFQQVERKARINKRIILTGFVQEEEIEKYFLAADVCVLPYREFISSSGPLSLALAYEKPIILSNELAAYLKSADIKYALQKAGLKKQALLVPITSKGLSLAFALANNREYEQRIRKLVKLVKESRSWARLGERYTEALFPREKRVAYSLALRYN